MFSDPSFTLADQLFWIVELFCKTMAPEACAPRFGALSVALWTRVRGLRRRFSTLYALWKAGRLPEASPPRSTGAAVGVSERGERREAPTALAPVDEARLRPASVLPREFRWMQRMLPLSAGALAGGIRSLVENYPEMREFAAACPQVGRIVRPLLRMAGLTAPDYLALPKRKRGSAPRPSPRGGEGDVQRPRRTAREVARAAIERAERTGKPVDPRKMGAVAYGYVLHWPRDGNCPPPEIGYGGRSFTPLPKDYVRPKDE